MAGEPLTTEGVPGYGGLVFTAGSPRANSECRLNAEAGALYSQVPKGKLWFCFQSLRKQNIFYTFAYLYRYNSGFMCLLLLYKGCTTKASCH